ncbi:MAG: PAS domain S-box protein [Gammaproteobacteria bacterium]|nr:PAS domain S-box protein [Gammaproteobacteria bacterium]
MNTPVFQKELLRYFGWKNRSGIVVLVLCLILLFLVWNHTRVNNEENLKERYDLYVQDITDAITNRLHQHEQILLGGAGLFDANPKVSRQDWHNYVQRLNLAKNYPGILGVGYSKIVQADKLAAHIAEIRAQGFPHFDVNPVGARPLYSSIIYLEPFSGRNLAAFGYDMLSQPTRADAMNLAAESGQTTISGKVTLVQETHGKIQAGFLMYVPIYREGLPLTTAQERRHALRGFVYSPYRVDDLMHGILGKRYHELDFVIYDGDKQGPDTLMYTSSTEHPQEPAPPEKPAMQSLSNINAYGHNWTIHFYSSPEFDARFDSAASDVALLLGGVASVLLFILVSFVNSRREQAEALVYHKTTEIQDNQLKLQQSEKRFDLAVRAANDGIWDWDIVRGTFYYSPRFRELLGFDEQELDETVDVFAMQQFPDSQFPDTNVLKDYLQAQSSFATICRMRNKAGDTRWFRNCGIAVRDAAGAPIRVVGSIHDITESRRAEEELQDTHTHTQTILDNVVDGIFTTDEAGNILSSNLACEKIYGYNADKLIGKHINTLFPQYIHDQNNRLFNAHPEKDIASNPGFNRETEGVRKNGSSFPIDLRVSTISMHGSPLFIFMVRDITERRKVEKMKSEFVSTVSHELRTPLTSIKGAIALVMSKSARQLPEKSYAMLETASRNCERLTVLINDILDLEKIESGRLQFEFKPVDLCSLVQSSLEANEPYAQQHGVRLQLETELEHAVVWGDNNRLHQVFANLLSNAIKFSPADGTVEVAITRHNRSFRLSVKDHGRGIPAEFRSHIFQRFAQADSSDTREKGGTGLGLSITRAIVERHGGHIDYRSSIGQGTEFYIDIHEYMDTVVPQPATAAGLQRVLVCQTNPGGNNDITGVFDASHIASDVATNALMANALLAEHDYDLMLVECELPNLDNVRILQQLEWQNGQRTRPIIILGDTIVADRMYWLQNDQVRQEIFSILKALLPPSARILHAAKDPDVIRSLQPLVSQIGKYDFTPTLMDTRRKLAAEKFDLVMIDCNMAEICGPELLEEISNKTPVMLFSNHNTRGTLYPRLADALIKNNAAHATQGHGFRTVINH